MKDTSRILAGALEQLHLILVVVPDMLTTGKYFLCLDSGAYLLCSGYHKYFPEGITPFTSGCQHMTGIGGNVEISVSGTIKCNFIYIKGHHKNSPRKWILHTRPW